MNARRAVRSFVYWLAPLGQVFLIDYGNGRRFVKVSTTSIAWEDGVPGQGDRGWKTTRRVRNIFPNRYYSRCCAVACEYV
ncbi:hypothetical protein HZ326_26589 [Fusarium oxysporum f. sp. albedinis]|nr:hypothetical protein HZ326_26589 [Fusarium oxysporum f. sp. albedinis]